MSTVIALGHLTAEVTLFPDPAASLAKARLLLPSLPSALPATLSVVGFIRSRLVPSPPSVSAHILVPPPHPQSPLCSVLARSLATERVCALVVLAPEWRALLTASPNLVLHVLRPGASLPGIGPLSKLVAYSSVAVTGRSPMELPLPMPSPANVPPQLVLPEDESMRNAVQRFMNLAAALPQSAGDAKAEFDRVVMSARVYRSPAMMAVFASCVAGCLEDAEARGSREAASILRDMSARLQSLLASLHNERASV